MLTSEDIWFLKEHLRVKVKKDTVCGLKTQLTVQLLFADEVISEAEVEICEYKESVQPL